MSYGYGGRANPFDQRENAPQGGYGQRAPYDGQQYGSQQYDGQQYGSAPAIGRDEYAGNVEMQPLTPNGGQFAAQSPEQNVRQQILNECKAINLDVKSIERNEFSELQRLQGNSLSKVERDPMDKRLEEATTKIMAKYRSLVDRVRKLKSIPGQSFTDSQVNITQKNVTEAMKTFQKVDNDYQKKLEEQMARQFRIVNPQASPQDVQKAVANGDSDGIFQQAVLQSNRRGQAQSIMSTVQSRHQEIQQIVRQMEELNKLFVEMNTLVVQQEEAVTNIEMKGEEVVVNMDKGNEQISTAIVSARNARKWKWWCLGIVVAIIAVIVIIVLIYKFVIQNNNTSSKSNKRFVLAATERRVVSPFSTSAEERSEIPGLKWTRDNTLAPAEERWVLEGIEWSPPSKKERRFLA